MKLFKEAQLLREYLSSKKQIQTGFVPTMGALHAGHLSLIEASRRDNDLTICSIFVNPTQFNNADDLAKYPRTIEKDIALLAQSGCDILFHPAVAEMYGSGEIAIGEDYGLITNSLEGSHRPGHFDGVITIVKKLFEAVRPHRAYFGQKDFQQCAVIQEMVRRHQFRVAIEVCSTMREPDGLAFSSRNARLGAEERLAALSIPQTLSRLRQRMQTLTAEQLVANATKEMNDSSAFIRVEYVAIVDPESFEPLSGKIGSRRAVALVAAWCGNVRLIDNLSLTD